MFPIIIRKDSLRRSQPRGQRRVRLGAEMLEVRALLSNLIVNGDFETGTLLPSNSDYTYSPGNIGPATVYDILKDPSKAHHLGVPYGDSTSGHGFMMAVNGPMPPNDNATVWSQNVTILPNTTYTLSLSTSNTLNTSLPGRPLTFFINGLPIGSTVTPSTPGVWQPYATSWNSGSNQTASIRIVAQSDVNGNTLSDFALDDISLVGPDKPDLSVTPPTWTAGQGVDFTYTISGADLTQAATVGLYWSTDMTYDDGQDEAAFTTLTQTATGSYTVSPTRDNLTPPPPGTQYLLAVVDPSNAVAESDEPNHPGEFGSNNVRSLQLPDLVPSLAQSAIHHLIYRGQSLSVPLIVSNQGGDASGNITIEYYLSTNSAATVDGPGNYVLKADTVDAATLPVGQAYLPTPTVTIPSFIVQDTYYLKVRIVGASVNPTFESDASNNLVVSEPLTACSDTNAMVGPRAQRYENAVTTAKASPSTPSDVFSDDVVRTYIKNNEEPGGYAAAPYLDQVGIATIGWGFALQYRDKNGHVKERDLAKDRIKDANLTYNGKKLNINDVLDFLKLPASQRPAILPKAVADQWFDEDYQTSKEAVRSQLPNFDRLSAQARQALIDMSYNLGPAFLGPNNFQRMRTNLLNGDIACAAFEMMDSLYADQLPGRARKNFLLLVSGFEGDL